MLCVGYLGEQIEEAIGDGAASASTSATPTTRRSWPGPAGAVRGALPLLGERFLVLYGDTYLRIDYADVAARVRARRAARR